nr:proline-, glutamic acid- and leucine-rich protein 1-like [Procambarus clarkii]
MFKKVFVSIRTDGAGKQQTQVYEVPHEADLHVAGCVSSSNMDVYTNICSRLHAPHVSSSATLLAEAVHNTGLFQNEIPHLLDAHVGDVNTLLNNGKTREDGVKLLLALVNQCPRRLLATQGERWFRFSGQVVSSVHGARAKTNACQVMTIILKSLPYIPELQRSVLSKPAAPLVLVLAAADSLWNCAALECLYEYLKLNPGQCLPHKMALEEHVIRYLDSPLTRVGQRDAVFLAGQVFAALPLPGVGGSGSQGRAEARGRQLAHLLALSHSLMDYLFDGIVEKENYEHTREYSLHLAPLESPGEINTDPLKTHLAAVTRLVNSLKFIAEMITSDANESVTVVPLDLLGVIFRLLQVDLPSLAKYRSQEHKLLAFLVPSLHQHCLLLLRDVLLSIGESVDMYFGVIADHLLSTIKTTVIPNQPGWGTSGQQMRIMAYSLMSTVIQVSSGRHKPDPQLISVVLQDVTPKSQTVTLQSKQKKGLSSLMLSKKKSKKKGYTVTVADSVSQAGLLPRIECFSRAARVGLSLIETLFTYASHSMTLKTQQSLQTSVMAVTATVAGATRIPVIYEDGKTRAQLFKTLASIATVPHPGCPPPYTVILHLLQKGQNDPDTLVVSTCQAALGGMSFIMANPQVCSLEHSSHHHPHNGTGNDVGEEDELINSIEEEPVEVNNKNTIEKPEKETGEEEEEKNETEDEKDETEEEKDEANISEDIEVEKMMIENDVEKEITKSLEEEQEEEVEDKENGEIIKETSQVGVPDKIKNGDERNSISSHKQTSQEDPVPRGKRSAAEDSTSRKKPKQKENKKPVEAPTLDEMLASFVDCDPDD